MGWMIFALLILAALLGVAFARGSHTNYRMGAGMFKSSENNLDEKEEFSDKEYYDEGKGLFK